MSFTVNFDARRLLAKLKKLEKPVDQKTAKAMGDSIVSDMKREIASGRSPIKGRGAFPAYKRPEKYPGDRKPHSPVNLELTGKQLAALYAYTTTSSSGYAAVISFKTDSARKKELGHREGVNKQPKRPTVPQNRERFVASIEGRYVEILRERLAKLLKST